MSKPDHVPAVIAAARAWARAYEAALDETREDLIGAALAHLSQCEDRLRRAVRRLDWGRGGANP